MRYAGEEDECFEGRVTGFGGFIRKWRIDELPQLFNVLKGEMSMVGPKPTLPYQVERCDERQRKRLCVRPGITGLGQVERDRAISWPERRERDIWYVENWSIMLDIKLMLRTPAAFIRIKDVNVREPPPDDEISARQKQATE